jgi:adenylate kinase family enzyme
MTTDQAYELVRVEQPAILYVTGKTCTGKTTFSKRLSRTGGYHSLALDEIVRDSVVVPFGMQSQEGDVFVDVYKTATNAAWIDSFVAETRRRLQQRLDSKQKLILDGALANTTVLRRIFDGLTDVISLYFHPQKTSTAYVRNLTARFRATSADNHNGLPNTFWSYIDHAAYAQFCRDKNITPALEKGIRRYASHSSEESSKRIQGLQEALPRLQVVEV